MRFLLLLQVLLAVLVMAATAADNSTKSAKKTLRMVKRIKKFSKGGKKGLKSRDLSKSASYRVPIVVSSEDLSHVPVKLELHDDPRYLQSAGDVHPIQPIHLVRVGGDYHHQQSHPLYVASREPRYGAYAPGGSHSDPVYQGPVAVPAKDAPRKVIEERSYSVVSPHDYYPDNYGDLSAIPGSPGVDYPVYSSLPKTGFECMEHTSTPGFYADVEAKCQMWHYCQPDGRHDRFLCPNGTVFDQLTRVCNWWFNVHCDSALSLYDVNFDLYREPLRVPSQSLDAKLYHEPQPQSRDAASYQPAEVAPALNRDVLYHSSVPALTRDVAGYQYSPSANPASVEAAPSPNSFLRHVKEFEETLARKPDDHQDEPVPRARPALAAAVPRAANRYPKMIAPAPKVQHDGYRQDSGNSDHRYAGDADHRRNLGNSDHRYADHTNSGNSDHRYASDTDYKSSGNSDHRYAGDADHRNSGNSVHRYTGDSDYKSSGNSGYRPIDNTDYRNQGDSGYRHVGDTDYRQLGNIDYDSSNAHALATPGDDLPLSKPSKSRHRKKKGARRKSRKQPKVYPKNAPDDIPTYREGVTPAPSASRRYRVVRRRKADKV